MPERILLLSKEDSSDMSTKALLLVDFQNDYFESGKWRLNETEAAAENGAKLLAAFRSRNLPIVHVRHEFPSDDAPFFVPGSEGAQIHSSVAPREDETVVTKSNINCFRDTNLKSVLDGSDVESLVVVGAMSHMCVDAAVRTATDHGYHCSVAHDACATLDQEFDGVNVSAREVHAAFMAALGFGYPNVADTDAILSEL